MATHRLFSLAFSELYPNYTAKAERKGRTRAEVDEIIRWLTGYTQDQLVQFVAPGASVTVEEFFAGAPNISRTRGLVTGVVCGVRVEEVADPLMREIRVLDKLIDELARGRTMAKILRTT